MKVICGLGNPGPEYDATRHNVGWWLVDRLSSDWGLGSFQRSGPALGVAGPVAAHMVLLLKPVTYMNRSGTALAPLLDDPEVEIGRDLLVVVDDVALDPGRARLRSSGSPGGHNGLKSIEAVLGTQDYARLRIGVGSPAPGDGLVDWVLSPMDAGDEEAVLGTFPDLMEGIRLWMDEDIDAAMSRINR